MLSNCRNSFKSNKRLTPACWRFHYYLNNFQYSSNCERNQLVFRNDVFFFLSLVFLNEFSSVVVICKLADCRHACMQCVWRIHRTLATEIGQISNCRKVLILSASFRLWFLPIVNTFFFCTWRVLWILLHISLRAEVFLCRALDRSYNLQ